MGTVERMEGWDIESKKFRRQNAVICEIVPGIQRTPLIGFYLHLTTLEHLSNLDEALNCFPDIDQCGCGTDGEPPQKHVAYFLKSFGLVDLLGLFRQLL